jgi:hypothetical protein
VKERGVGPGGQADNGELIGHPARDLKGVGADGAGRTEDGDLLHFQKNLMK